MEALAEAQLEYFQNDVNEIQDRIILDDLDDELCDELLIMTYICTYMS